MKKKKRVVAKKGTKRLQGEGSKISNRAPAADVATIRHERRFIRDMAAWLVKNCDEPLLRTEMTNIIQGLDPRHLEDIFMGLVKLICDTGDATEVERFTRRGTMVTDWILRYGPIRRGEAAVLSKTVNCLAKTVAKRAAA